MPRPTRRIVRTIDKYYSGSLDLAPEVKHFGHAIVRDASQKKGYRCHLYLDPGDRDDADLVLRVMADLAVPQYRATDLLNREGAFEFAERLGRLHFYFMPRVLAALDDEIATWKGEQAPGYRERPSYTMTALSLWDIGHPSRRGWSHVYPHRSAEGLFGASRIVKNALSRDVWVPERLESLMRGVPYERARVTLFA